MAAAIPSPDNNFCADINIKLPSGLTAYKLIAPISGEPKMTIVCLHGFHTSSWMWSDIAEIFTDEVCGPGAQVLVFDFYGHGRSPWTGAFQCTLNVLVSQTVELLDILNFKEPVSLVGHCMGGAVAVGFAAKYPDRCSSLCIFGSLGLYTRRTFSDNLLKVPCIGDLLMLKRKAKLAPEQKQEFFNLDDDSDHRVLINKQIAMVQWQLQHTPGYLSAVLSRFRSFPVEGMGELFDLVGRHPSRPVLVIWGDHDVVCPFELVRSDLEESFPRGTITVLEHCGHNPLFEQFYQFATFTVDFHADLLDLSKGRSVSLRVADRNYKKNMIEFGKPSATATATATATADSGNNSNSKGAKSRLSMAPSLAATASRK